MDVHLRDLRYFVAVAEELHFTRAAERLYVSQPAVSKQVRALETQLGFDLFERQTQNVVLTARGAALLPVARELLAGWQDGLRAARAAGEQQVLVVGMHTAVGRDLQPRAMRAFRERFPDCALSLRLVSWTDPTAGLGDGSSDVALIWLPLTGAGVSTRVLVRERRLVALPKDHPLADRTDLTFGDLRDEPFVALVPEAGRLREFWLGNDARGGRKAVIGAEATSADDAFEAVSAGLGIMLIAEGNVPLYRRQGITFSPLPDLAPAELAVAWRTNDDRPAIAELVTSFEAAAAAR
jgi:DNA-binding transcriptional LysR family regulator